MYQSTHTGTQVDEAVDKVLESPISVMSNRNILDNWFFANPVNQRGKTSYSANNAYCIDRWKYYGTIPVTLQSGGIRLGDTTSNVVTYIRQFIDTPTLYAGKTLTYSLLVKDLDGTGSKGFIRWYVNDVEQTASFIAGELTTLTLTVPTSLSLLYFDIGSYWNNAFTAVSVKLELGSVSTLANDTPPDYGEELTRCIYSTADSGDTYANTGFGFARANRNLLDNAYFVGGGSQQGGGQFPINQRGQTTYSNAGHGIDRWIVNGDGSLALNTGYIFLETRTMYGGFTQRFEEGAIKDGSKLTLSVLTDTGLYSVTFTASKTTPYSSDTTWLGVSGLYAYFGWYSSGGAQYWQIYIVDNADGQSHTVNLIAAKLEMGEDQTLAHQENGVWVLNEIPSFAEELLKCQRYAFVPQIQSGAQYLAPAFNLGASSSSTLNAFIYTPVVMRSTPTASGSLHSIRGNGVQINSSISIGTALAPIGNTVIVPITTSSSFSALTMGYGVLFNSLILSADL